MLRKHNKLVVLAVLLTFLFSIVGTASAASIPTDIQGKDYEEAVTELAALDILTGYPDGSFQADNKITRAEFAAVAVRELGLDASAKYSQGATKFSDVGADHWASGYINVAVDQGLLKGYPDGTFGPEANVTYAEAVAILVRALGYEPAVKGEWPTGYLAKGNEIGVTDDVTVVAGAPASRGDVAIMAANALDINMMYQVSYGTEVEYKYDDDSKTILSEKLDLTVLEEKDVIKTPKVSLGDLDTDEITIVTSEDDAATQKSKTYEVVAGIDPNKYFGLNVTAWIDDDDVVKYIKTETDSDRILSERVKDVDADDNEEVYLNEKDASYEINEDAVLYVDGTKYGVNAFEALMNTAASGRIVLNSTDEITYAELYTYDKSNAIITEVGEDYIKYWHASDCTTDADEIEINKLSLDDDDYTYLIQRGATTDLKALKVGDRMSFHDYDDDDFMLISAGAKNVTGKLEEVWNDNVNVYGVSTTRAVLTVDGKDYVGGSTVTFSTDDNEEAAKMDELADLEDMIGEEVNITLSGYNEVVHVSATVDSTADTYALVVDKSAGTMTDEVKLFTQEGIVVTYEYTSDTTAVNSDSDFGDLAPGELVKFSVASDGTLDEIEYLAYTSAANADGEVDVLDDDDDFIAIDANGDGDINDADEGRYYVDAEKTIIFNWSDYIEGTEDEDDLSIVEWNDLEDKEADTLWLGVYSKDGNHDVNVVVLTSGYADVAGDENIGVVKKVKYDGDDYVITADVEGTDVSYKAASDPQGKALAEGDVIAFTVTGSGKMGDIQEITINAGGMGALAAPYATIFSKVYYEVQDTGSNSIKLNGSWYTTNSATIYYDVEDGDADEKAFGDVDTVDTVTIIQDLTNGLVKAVIFKGDK